MQLARKMHLRISDTELGNNPILFQFIHNVPGISNSFLEYFLFAKWEMWSLNFIHCNGIVGHNIHIIQVTQNVTSIANFNLVLDIEIESTGHTSRG